jgi:hypothetical protein
MFNGILNLIIQIVEAISGPIYLFLNVIFGDYSFNIYLFSDTGWFSPSIPLNDLINMILVTSLFIFLMRLLWKGTKKFINMIFGVFRV